MITPATPVREDADHAPLLERAFALDIREGDYRIEDIDGTLPDFVRGSYYVNGPARFHNGSLAYRHWLDGDGMICALHFDGSSIRFVNRFVRGAKFTAEAEAGRPLFRSFGTAFDGDRLQRGIGLESPVNVSVYPFAGTLLAFGEQGLPWELDPLTLETRGLYDFGHKLNPISPFSAHANIDYETGELFNFGVSFSATRPQLNLYRFGNDGRLVYRRRLGIEFPCSLHDFGLSPNFSVFYLSPHLLAMEKLLGGSTLLEALSWEPELGSRMVIARREDGEHVSTVSIGSRYSLHQANCFEREGRLVVDVIELDEPVYDQYDVPGLFTDVRRARPVRYVVDPEAGELLERVALDHHLMCDFPGIDPRYSTHEYRDFWVLAISATEAPGRKFFDRLVHLDWARGEVGHYQSPPTRYLGGEPVFVGDPDATDRGVILCQEFDAESRVSSFLVFDAFDVVAGPVARLRLRTPVHLGFHACFAPSGVS